MRVLILENDINIRKKIELEISTTLETTKIDSFRQISDAEKAIQNNVYDLISLDTHLPDGNGLDFAKKIRLSHLNEHAHLLIISADNNLDTALKAYDQSRCFKFLNKPYDNQELTEVLTQVKELILKTPQKSYFVYNNRQLMIKVPTNEILYFEIFYKSCHICTYQDTITMNRYPLKEVLSAVNQKLFIQVHRSFVINTKHILKVALLDKQWYCYLTHQAVKIPIGKKFLDDVKNYMKKT